MKVISFKQLILIGGEAREICASQQEMWLYKKKMKLLEDMSSLEEHLFGIWKRLNVIQNFSAIYFAFLFISFSYLLVELSSRYLCVIV